MSSEVDRAARVAMAGIRVAVIAAGIQGRALVSVTYYLTVTICNVPGAVVARAAGCTRQNVAKSVAHVEERREDPAFDRVLSGIEQAFGGADA
ncbi:MAG: hypothetical protein CMF72_22785 [Mameliella sp.]|nr:hypothetical protein [Mameliella sp.]|tara:strand:- start:816 stop:1094 length:279 start_codon:yes stop_codon:yes gene_type:complete